MTPESGHGADEPDDTELGAPVAELRDVSWPLDERFPVKVKARIERRLLAGSFLELFWNAPLTVLLEFLRWPFERLPSQRKQGRQ